MNRCAAADELKRKLRRQSSVRRHIHASLIVSAAFAANGLVALGCSDAGGAPGSVDSDSGSSAGDAGSELVADAATSHDGGDSGADGATPALRALYVGACLTRLSGEHLEKANRFYTEVKYTPPVATALATIELKLTALRAQTGSIAPPVSKSATVGETYVIPQEVVSKTGVYAGSLGTVIIPGASDPGGVFPDATFEQTMRPGRFGVGSLPATFCSQFNGHMVSPNDRVFEGDANRCLYIRVNEGDPTPTLNPADFPATCSLQD